MVEEFQTLDDLRDDVLRDEFAAGVEREGAEVREKLRGGGGEERGERERRGPAVAKLKLHGARDAVEAPAVTLGAGRAGVGDVVG